ncbi:MAG: ABC transporter permease subunit [Salinibacterium sp.]|nr:ABC transporter permease subunit [Salinibacterium sp.]MBF0672542.1 ABC transporter permease subunit [Salinibacterium sp.]
MKSRTQQTSPERGRRSSRRQAAARGSKAAVVVRRIVAIALLLVLWQVAVLTGIAPGLTPRVDRVALALIEILGRADFWLALLQTVSAALTGVAIATVVGVTIGLLVGSIPAAGRAVGLILDFGRSFPTIALLPVLILVIGANWRMEVLVVSLAAVWPILVQSLYGAQQMTSAASEMTRSYRIPPLLKFRRVLLPSALPMISTGIRIAVAISILVAVGVEVLSQTPGLGRLITLAQGGGRWDLAFAYLFLIGCFGWGVTALLARAEGRLLRWNRLGEK